LIRNADVYGNNVKGQQKHKTKVLQQLTKEYNQRWMDLHLADRNSMPERVEEFISSTKPWALRLWAITTRPLI